MKKSQIILSKYSPLMAVDTVLRGSDGEVIETPRVCSLCRCGESAMKPLCDGTHATVGFDGTREDSEKAEIEHYEGKEITIVFDRYLCMGAGYCGELEPVFGTHDEPKYEPDEGSVEDIIATIKKCPSGALSYIIDGVHHKNYFKVTQIAVEKDGPYNCEGDIGLIDDQDSDTLLPDADHYTLCRCGGSKKKPICDGSHAENGFKG
ncbi:MAG: CDGSH iron-sulfur domain-containing protein [Desulfocapsaceae bacterium]|nr:CDGSH iron-sulfur domain-containing protein [Desulfocapsaceae bacterium]